VVVGDDVLVDEPLEAPAALGLSDVAGVGAGPTRRGLPVAVRLGAVDLDREPATDLLAAENRIDAMLELFVRAAT
jgi:hypothetical protein